jgi:hypothetical protein
MDDIQEQHSEELERFTKEMENDTSPSEKEEFAADLEELKESNRINESSEEEEDSS